jgi:hypothetical protein
MAATHSPLSEADGLAANLRWWRSGGQGHAVAGYLCHGSPRHIRPTGRPIEATQLVLAERSRGFVTSRLIGGLSHEGTVTPPTRPCCPGAPKIRGLVILSGRNQYTKPKAYREGVSRRDSNPLSSSCPFCIGQRDTAALSRYAAGSIRRDFIRSARHTHPSTTTVSTMLSRLSSM